jgi:alkanesulfonate monooxygenase SsuD/methylene tetrahydromethanopterin reductase-like flavin-dependent oxidoreductase (luciferase family)
MRFGWLTLAHSPSPEEDYASIEQQLAQACHADALGFHGIWLTEHTFTGEAIYCDPIPFGATLAAQMVLGDLAHDKVMASMRRFADAVMPRFPDD